MHKQISQKVHEQLIAKKISPEKKLSAYACFSYNPSVSCCQAIYWIRKKPLPVSVWQFFGCYWERMKFKYLRTYLCKSVQNLRLSMQLSYLLIWYFWIHSANNLLQKSNRFQGSQQRQLIEAYPYFALFYYYWQKNFQIFELRNGHLILLRWNAKNSKTISN